MKLGDTDPVNSSLTSLKAALKVEGHPVHERKCSFAPAGGNPEGGEHETSRDESLAHPVQPVSSGFLSCPSSL